MKANQSIQLTKLVSGENTRQVCIRLVAIILFFFSITELSAQRTYTWTGGTNTAWNNTNNWTKVPAGGTFPGDGAANDIVVIPAGTNQPTLNVTLANPIASLTFTSTNTTTLTITGVTLIVSGNVTVNSADANRSITITGTGSLECNALNVGTVLGALGGNRVLTFVHTLSATTVTNNLSIAIARVGTRNASTTFTHTSGTITAANMTVSYSGTSNTGPVSTYTMGNTNPRLNLTSATPFTVAADGTKTFTLTGTGATVDYQSSSNVTFLTNAGLNSYRNLIISGGGGNIKTASANITLTGTLTVEAASTLAMGTFTLSGALGIVMETGNALNGAAITGTGLITLGASGGLTLNNSPAGVGSTAASISNPISLANVSRTFLINDDGNTTNQDLTISGVISSSGTTGGIVKSGTGTLELIGTNTYTGTTSITAGVIEINTIANAAVACSLGAPAAGQSTISITGGAMLRYTGSGHSSSRPIALATSTGGIIDASGSGLLTLSGAMSGNTFGVVLTGTGTGLYTGAIGTTSGTVTKTGTGTWELSGTSTYTGVTTISEGTLLIGGAVAVSTNGPVGNATSDIIMGDATTTSNNASPRLIIDGAFTFARPITIANQSTSGTYSIGGNTDNNATFSGAITFSQPFSITQVPTTGVNALTVSSTITGGLAGNKLITFDNEGTVIKSTGIISDGTGLTLVRKQNTGVLTISSANTFTGGTTLAVGTLNINNTSALGDGTGTFTIDGGTIQNTTGGLITTNNHPMQWNGDFNFTGTQSLNLGSGAVTMGFSIEITIDPSITLTVGGTLNNPTRNLIKAGSGSLDFTNQTVSLNGLTIDVGTLTASSGTMNISGAFTNNATFVNNGGTVNMNAASSSIVNTSTLTFNNLTIAVTPTSQTQYDVSYSVAGALTINGGVTFAPTGGTITMSAAGSSIANSGTKTFNNLTIAATPTAQSQYNTSFEVAGALTVNGGVTFAPTGGTITMSAVGSSISNGGTLTFQNLIIAATPTAQSQYNTSYNIASVLTINGSVIFAPTGGTITMNNAASSISNSGTLTFNNITISATPTSQAQYNTSFSVASTFATSGAITFAPTGGTITMSGASGAINNTSGTLTFQNLTISGTTVSSTGNFAVAATMSVTGVFNPSATSIISGVTGTLTGTGTVNVTRTAATPSFGAQYTINTKTLSSLTVNYNGAGAQTVDEQNYGNLTISTNGTRTVTFVSGGTIRVSGVFTPTATTTTYVVANNNFEYNGSGAQTITAFTYNNLILSNAGAKTVLAGTTVNCLTITLNDTAVLTLPDTSTLNITQ